MRGLPEFPDSEWVKVFQGKLVDFDVVFSEIHLTVSDNHATEMFGDFKLRFSHTKPAKLIKSHRGASVHPQSLRYIYVSS